MAQPAVAVVPGADHVPVQPVQFGREHGVDIRVGVAADRGEAGIEADVLEVVHVREQADPGEHAHAGDEDEADMGGAVLDDAVDTAQVLPVGAGPVGVGQPVKDRLVVFIDEDHDTLAGGVMQVVEKRLQTLGRGVRAGQRHQSGRVLDQAGLVGDAALNILRPVGHTCRQSSGAPRDGSPTSPSGHGWPALGRGPPAPRRGP